MVLLNKRGIPVDIKAALQLNLQPIRRTNGTLFFDRNEEVRQAVDILHKNAEFAAVSTGELNGLYLIIRIYRFILQNYLDGKAPAAAAEILRELNSKTDQVQIIKYQEDLKSRFQSGENETVTETIILWLCNQNQAFQPFLPFFDQKNLKNEKMLERLVECSQKYFSHSAKVMDEYSLFDLLLLPSRRHPYSIYDQLLFIRANFGEILGDLLWQILEGLDTLQEENAFRGGGPGPADIYDFSDEEYERFSEDQDWMSKLVLLAKSTYVWLSQLSLKYGRQISKLEEIPLEELAEIAANGFSGIWLIGIWERSEASRKFKQLKGNREAMASAYSLRNYHVAADLGGDESMQKLQNKAWHFGIRIGCDMVPNHMGIDSDWIVEHPDWFLQESQPPYASYSFNSHNLSSRSEIEIYLEDHYFDERDAAVVFKLYDKRDHRTRFIYHGNDGTSIPWNDTAQLNYLLPEVREAVINEIIGIARRFPIIRFDAAMTLAKKHIQRLWFPERGSGGAIPSRSRHALSKEEFNYHIPQEFWREVVDRIALQTPDTLLLAEAFWMMEGYFVRTLGMHRVYNSAFMNMLKAEENHKYRQSIKNVLTFNPQILKRFVNFMSNPDEETALAQFGTDDKYFGVCVLMATMPGLPMFAHGQIEGLSERYGMEFAKPRSQEKADMNLVERHQKEIFPLLRKRYLFANVEKFVLYDFQTDNDQLNEDVFAYSNAADHQNSLVVFHNAYRETSGFVHRADEPFYVESNIIWQPTTLAKSWNLHDQDNWFTIFTDAISGLTYIRKSADLHRSGLHLILNAFKYFVFWQVQEIEDSEGKYADLFDHLQMAGTRNISRELKRLEYRDMLNAVGRIISPDLLKQIQINWQKEPVKFIKNFQQELEFRLNADVIDFLKSLNLELDREIAKNIILNLKRLLRSKSEKLTDEEQLLFIAAVMIAPLTGILAQKFGDDWYEESQLQYEISDILAAALSDQNRNNTLSIAALIEIDNYIRKKLPSDSWLEMIIKKPHIIRFLKINEFDRVLWFDQQRMEKFLRWMKFMVWVHHKTGKSPNRWQKHIENMEKVQAASEFQVAKLITILKKKEYHDD